MSHGQGHFSRGLKDAWDTLFNEHEDLRNEFIHGLQAGPGQLGVVGAYFATSATVVVGTGGGGGGVGRSEAVKGKEKEKGEGIGSVDTGREVVIKEEESGEMKVLSETKATRV